MATWACHNFGHPKAKSFIIILILQLLITLSRLSLALLYVKQTFLVPLPSKLLFKPSPYALDMAAPRSRKPYSSSKHKAKSGRDLSFVVRAAKGLLLLFCVLGLLYFFPSLLAACRDVIPRVWHGLEGCFTPPVLFLLTNLVIAAVVLTSGLVQRTKRSHGSVVMEEELDEEEESDGVKSSSGQQQKPSLPPRPAAGKSVRLVRSKSEHFPAGKNKREAGQMPRASRSGAAFEAKPAHKRSASSGMDHSSHNDEDEVDKKAEAFIGRFYQQMKLQKLESLLRYKERINRSQG